MINLNLSLFHQVKLQNKTYLLYFMLVMFIKEVAIVKISKNLSRSNVQKPVFFGSFVLIAVAFAKSNFIMLNVTLIFRTSVFNFQRVFFQNSDKICSY